MQYLHNVYVIYWLPVQPYTLLMSFVENIMSKMCRITIMFNSTNALSIWSIDWLELMSFGEYIICVCTLLLFIVNISWWKSDENEWKSNDYILHSNVLDTWTKSLLTKQLYGYSREHINSNTSNFSNFWLHSPHLKAIIINPHFCHWFS